MQPGCSYHICPASPRENPSAYSRWRAIEIDTPSPSIVVISYAFGSSLGDVRIVEVNRIAGVKEARRRDTNPFSTLAIRKSCPVSLT
jgi:hypothetical protein